MDGISSGIRRGAGGCVTRLEQLPGALGARQKLALAASSPAREDVKGIRAHRES